MRLCFMLVSMMILNKSIQRGFILIELLIALVTIAISFSIAMQFLFTSQHLQYQLYEQLKKHLASPTQQESRQHSQLMKGR